MVYEAFVVLFILIQISHKVFEEVAFIFETKTTYIITVQENRSKISPSHRSTLYSLGRKMYMYVNRVEP